MRLHQVRAGRIFRSWRSALALLGGSLLAAATLDVAAAAPGDWTLTKSASPTTFSAAGQTITYTYKLKNNKDTDGHIITKTDSKGVAISCPSTAVPALATVTCTGTYTTTAADVAAATITNVATFTGDSCNDGCSTTATASASVKFVAPPPTPGGAGPTTPTINPTATILQTQAVIQNFLSQQLLLLLLDGPDRVSFWRRFPGALWGQSGSSGGTTSTLPLGFAASDTGAFSEMSVSTSLSQLAMSYAKQKNEKRSASALDSPQKPVPWTSPYGVDVWAEAHLNRFQANGGTINNRGNFNVVYVGADVLVTQSTMLGALVQFDWANESSAVASTSIGGRGWMAGPYLSSQIAPNLFFDARAQWGKSSNVVSPFGTYQDSFSADRWLARAALTGNWWMGSFRVTPTAGVTYIEQKQLSYVDSNGFIIPDQRAALGRVDVGPEFGYLIVGSNGTTYEPHLAVKALWDFVKPGTALISGIAVGNDTVHAMVQGGVLAHLRNGLAIRVAGQYDGIGSSNFRSYGGQVWLNVPLH